eukprot:jgi/Bigna1/143822/aug1.81_g18530
MQCKGLRNFFLLDGKLEHSSFVGTLLAILVILVGNMYLNLKKLEYAAANPVTSVEIERIRNYPELSKFIADASQGRNGTSIGAARGLLHAKSAGGSDAIVLSPYQSADIKVVLVELILVFESKKGRYKVLHAESFQRISSNVSAPGDPISLWNAAYEARVELEKLTKLDGSVAYKPLINLAPVNDLQTQDTNNSDGTITQGWKADILGEISFVNPVGFEWNIKAFKEQQAFTYLDLLTSFFSFISVVMLLFEMGFTFDPQEEHVVCWWVQNVTETMYTGKIYFRFGERCKELENSMKRVHPMLKKEWIGRRKRKKNADPISLEKENPTSSATSAIGEQSIRQGYLLDSDCKQQQLQQQHPVDDTEQQNIGNVSSTS